LQPSGKVFQPHEKLCSSPGNLSASRESFAAGPSDSSSGWYPFGTAFTFDVIVLDVLGKPYDIENIDPMPPRRSRAAG
jgi:hypothetical protein